MHEGHFFHAKAIAVCEKSKSLYFHSDEIKLVEDSHLPRNKFLHQEQKHQYIHCKNLTHMTTLVDLYIFQ